MPTFEFQHPDGSSYDFSAPDEKSAVEAFNKHVMSQTSTAPLPEAEWGPPAGFSPDSQKDFLAGQAQSAKEGALPAAGLAFGGMAGKAGYSALSPKGQAMLKYLGTTATSAGILKAADALDLPSWAKDAAHNIALVLQFGSHK